MADFLELSIEVSGSRADSFCQVFDRHGALSVVIESASGEIQVDEAFPSDPNWRSQRITALFGKDSPVVDIAADINTVNGGHLDIRLKKVEDRDWVGGFQGANAPFEAAPGLWICPSWCEPVDPGAINLVIDPGLAFGTGSHETTALCLQAMRDLGLDGDRVMDYGCGSGILAIAAIKLGALSATAVDIDSQAVAAARENARVNGVDDRLEVLSVEEADQAQNATYDVVVANILANTLVDLHHTIRAMAAPGGTLILSGILGEQVDSLRSCYSSFEFNCTRKNDWAVLVGQRTADAA